MATQNYFKVKNGLEFPSIETLQTTDNTGPSIKPSLNLDFAKTKQLDPRITFTRASTATYYDGKTTAIAEQNLNINSADWNSSTVKINVTTTADSVVAPDGTTTADTVTETAVAGVHRIDSEPTSVSFVAGATYTGSFYAKAGTSSIIAMTLNGTYINASAPAYANFDLVNGVVTYVRDGCTASIVFVGNGWYRCTVTGTATASGTGQAFIVSGCNNNPSATRLLSYTGSTSSYFYLWGSQFEQRSTATAYTRTTTSPIINYIPVLQTAAVNTARFDHDPVTGESKGLLIEESRTNLFLSSNVFTSPTWSFQNASASQSATTAPDGTNTANYVVLTGTTSSYIYQNVTPSTGTAYTVSAWVKSATGSNQTFRLFGNGANQFSADQTATSTWQRFTFSSTSTGGSGAGLACDAALTSSNLLVWGMQIEAGTFATSYIPTALTYNGRYTSATYRSSFGIIKSAAPNVARYEPNSSGGSNLLVEAASANLMTYSDTISGSLNAATLVKAHNIIAPDGSVAQKLQEDTQNTSHVMSRTFTAVTNSVYTGSVYVKAAERTRVLFDFFAGTAEAFAYVTLTGSGTITTSAGTVGVTALPGGWYRITATVTAQNTNGTAYVFIANDAGAYSYTGTSGSGLYVWGLQVENSGSATSYIPSIETHTGRTSTGTYYDVNGILRTAASGTARYTYNPLMLSATPKLSIESQATNYVTYSTALSSSSLTYNGAVNPVTANATTAPDGTTTATKIVESNANTRHEVDVVVNGLTNGTIYTTSLYVKAAERYVFSLSNAGAPSITLDMSTGTFVTSGAGISSTGAAYVGNGWWRVWIAVAAGTGAQNMYMGIEVPGTNGYAGYQGDGTSGLYVWGMQVEAGIGVSSLIPTTSASVTRAADTSTSAAQSRGADVYSSAQATRTVDLPIIAGSSLTSLYRQDEGTFTVEWYDRAQSSTHQLFYIYDLTNANNRINLAPNSGNVLDGAVVVNGSDYVDSLTPTVSAGYHKAAFAYKTNDSAITMDGASTTTDTTCILPYTLQQLNIGIGAGSTQPLNSTMKKLAYYPKRLTNAEIVSLTS